MAMMILDTVIKCKFLFSACYLKMDGVIIVSQGTILLHLFAKKFMERKDKNQHQKHEENQSSEESLGNKSFAGATTTDLDKQRMQTVEANDLDDTGTRNENEGNKNKDQNRTEMDNRAGEENRDDRIDPGSIRTAAFDEGNEPRTEESLKNRGATQGSNDVPGI